ncbi:TPA: virulence factor TspB C-terminal domain-related protein [Photobacterium damselae]
MKWILILVTVLYSSLSYSSTDAWQEDSPGDVACLPIEQNKDPDGGICKDRIAGNSGWNDFEQCYFNFEPLSPKRDGWGVYAWTTRTSKLCIPKCESGSPVYPSTSCDTPENKCKVPAGEILARRSGIEGANGRYYCVKQCSGIAKQVGDMCIAVGDGPNICDYELISSGVDCDGNGDGSTDGDGSGNPPPPPEPIPPETGDGSNDNGDGSLEPDINGDGSGGSGDINGDGTINGADYGGNLAKIVENTAKTAVAVNTNTNMITDAINKQTKAITDAVNNGNGSGNGSGTPDGDGDGEADSVNGGSCEQFVCNGPAVQCYIAQKQWEQKCDIEGVIAQNEKPVIDGINTFINDNPITNIEAGTLDISTYFNKYDGSNGIQTGGSCPAPISISLGEYGSHTVKLDPLCELAVIIRVFLQITAVVSVGLMFAKYS